jgi:hypothetical protein
MSVNLSWFLRPVGPSDFSHFSSSDVSDISASVQPTHQSSSCLFRKIFWRRWSSSGIQFGHIDCVCEICTTGQSTHDHRLQMEEPLTPEQEKQLEYLDAEIQILEKQLRISEVRKRIAETELEVVSLQESLQQHLREEIRGR